MSPWIGPGPDDRHLDDEIVEGLAASGAAASPSAPGSRSGRRRWCRPGGSSRRSSRPPPESSRGRESSSLCSRSRSKARRMQPSMPRPSTSTFMNFRVSMSSLSHSITCRFSIAAGSIGTRSSRRSWVSTKPPGCCERWRGAPISSLREFEGQAQARIVEVEVEVARLAARRRRHCSSPRRGRRAPPSRPRARPAPCRPRARRRGRGSRSRRR